MRQQGSDRQHGFAGAFGGQSDTIATRHHYHCGGSNLSKVIVVASDRRGQRELQHCGKREREKIGSSV